jgi:hypothetical protein
LVDLYHTQSASGCEHQRRPRTLSATSSLIGTTQEQQL